VKYISEHHNQSATCGKPGTAGSDCPRSTRRSAAKRARRVCPAFVWSPDAPARLRRTAFGYLAVVVRGSVFHAPPSRPAPCCA